MAYIISRSLGYHLGNSIAINSLRANVVWDARAESLIAQMIALNETPTLAVQRNINECIVFLKASSLFDTKLDCLWIPQFPGIGVESAKLNWIKNAHNCTKGGAGTLTFASGTGFTSDGTTYLDTNYKPSTEASKYTQDNAGFGVKLTGTLGTNSGHGMYKSGSPSLLIAKAGSTGVHRINTPTTTSYALISTQGYNTISRISSTRVNVFVNYGKYIGNSDNISTGLPAYNLFLLAYNTSTAATYFDTASLNAAWIGELFSEQEHLTFEAVMNRYLEPAKLFTKGMISIEHDEQYLNLMTLAYPMYVARGKKSNVAFISGDGLHDLLTWENITTLKNAGWCIIDHMYTHATFGTITAEQRTAEIVSANNKFIANGLSAPEHYTFPGGVLDQTQINAISGGRISSKGNEVSTNMTAPIFKTQDKYRIPYREADNAKLTLAEIYKIIDDCKIGKHIITFNTHQTFADTGAAGGIDISKLTAIIDYAIASDVDIITMEDLYPLLN